MRKRCCAGLLAVALLAIGCGSVPDGGAVHLGRAVPAQGGLDDFGVRVFPPVWQAGLSPHDVVADFLHALVNNDADYAFARTYLTSAASAKWRADTGITAYDDSALQLTVSGSRVLLNAPRVGTIDRHGSYQTGSGDVAATFGMSHVGGNWRIDKLPDGVLLSESDLQRTFHLAYLYYLNPSGTLLVPDPVLLRDTQHGLATDLVSTLLAGPSDWLAPAVRTALPQGVGLIGNVPLHDDGTVDVNLSASIRNASATDLAALSAQLVWTLQQVQGVVAVRLLADGAPLSVPGQPSRQSVHAWPSFNPAGPAAVKGLLYVHGGHLGATGADAATTVSAAPAHVWAAARSVDGSTLAVVQQTSTAFRLLVGKPGKRLVAHVRAASMTPPTFDADGDVVTVVTNASGRHVVAVDASGRAHEISADSSLLRQPVTSLRIAPDGARVAAVVGAGRLLVGRVSGHGTSESVSGFRAIAPSLQFVRGVSWLGSDALFVTCAGSANQRRVIQTDLDGYALQQVSLPFAGSPIDVASGAGQPLTVATDDGSLWQDLGGWHRLAAGSAPVYSG